MLLDNRLIRLSKRIAKMFLTFQALSAMPADILRAYAVSDRPVRIQSHSTRLTTWTRPKTFYHREDQWQIPAAAIKGETISFMRHIVMRVPGEKQAEYIYMAPFTPERKGQPRRVDDRRNDGANYGKLRVYRFPKQTLVYGPHRSSARINQDTDISRELTLWDQRGSEVIGGSCYVIPIEEALIYVQPIYLRAKADKFPSSSESSLRIRIVLSCGDFEAGLARCSVGTIAAQRQAADSSAQQDTSQASRPSSAGPPTANQQMLKEANDHYQRAISAQRAGIGRLTAGKSSSSVKF